MYVLNNITIPTPPIVQVLPPIPQDLNKGLGEVMRPNQLCIDVYGNRIFWATLKVLLKRGYYNDWERKKATANFKPYGWRYSAEELIMRRNLDPKKYTEDLTFVDAERLLMPLHILDRYKRKG